MATLCVRHADCFAARAFFEAPLRPMQQRKSQATAPRPAPGPARGRACNANGRPRRRRSPPAAMENVVILKRGEQVPPVFTEASTVETKVHESVEAAKQSSAEAPEKEEPVDVAAADRHGADATIAEAVAAAARPRRTTLPQAEEAGRAPLSAATAQPAPSAPYAGASFLVAAPDPRALPIPGLLLKARGRGARPRIRALDDERAPAPAAAAA